MQIDQAWKVGEHYAVVIGGTQWTGIEIDDPDSRFAAALRGWIAAGNTVGSAPAPELDAYKAGATERVDTASESKRMEGLTAGVGQQTEYNQVALEAAAVLQTQGAVTAAEFPLLAASIGSDVPKTNNENADLRAAALVIQQARSAVYNRGVAIRKERLRLKRSIEAATTVAEIDTILASSQWPS